MKKTMATGKKKDDPMSKLNYLVEVITKNI